VLRIVTVYPDLLGTYGDRGNGLVLRRRAELRGIGVELVEARSDEPLARGDLYCLGGGEDGPQQLAVERLRDDGTLVRVVGDGAVVLAVCAGLQVLGRSFPVAHGVRVDGLGLLPVDTVASTEPRAVGEVLVDTGSLGALSGFENHAGRTVLDEGATALGLVRRGVGNGDGTDGVVTDRLLGTYLHGPVLARNPAFADHLLALALGVTLEPLVAGPPELLHDERLVAGRRVPTR
jgi:lipid II isoglutaminyl synthase (glutamine-hydrolysing)